MSTTKYDLKKRKRSKRKKKKSSKKERFTKKSRERRKYTKRRRRRRKLKRIMKGGVVLPVAERREVTVVFNRDDFQPINSSTNTPRLGITFKKVGDGRHVKISSIKPASAAARKPELELGLLLTHVNEVNVENSALKWQVGVDEAAANLLKDALRELANGGNRPFTLEFKQLGEEGDPEPDPLNPIPKLVSGNPFSLPAR